MHRFLLICPIYEPYAGGGGQYFPYLRNSILMQCGFYSIDVITEYHSSKPTIERDPKGVIYRVLPKRDSKENKTYIYSVLSFILTYAILSFFLIFLTFYRRYDTLQFTRYYRSFFYSFLRLLKNIRTIKIYCDLRATVGNFDVLNGLQFCDKILCNSFAVYTQATNIPKIKVNVFL